MSLAATRFSVLLFGLVHALRLQARRYPEFAKRLAEKNFTAQIATADKAIGRWYTFKDGRVLSKRGMHASPDITITVSSAEVGARLFVPWVDQLERIEAMKNFQFSADGPDELVVRFTQTIMMMQSLGIEYGVAMADGTRRYVTNTNGGPLFVYVKKTEAEKPEVKAFVDFYIENAGKLSAEVGYVKFPDRLYNLVRTRWESRKVGTMYANAPAGATLEQLLARP